MKLRLRKLNTSGVAHHALIAIIVIAGFASFGAWRVFTSNAATSQYAIPVSSELGCDLAGRVYSATAKEDKCQPKCKVASAKYIPYDSKTKTPAYCQGYVNTEMDQARCIDQLHRAFINNLGCARKANQDNSNNSKYCPDKAFPNYVAEGTTDRCIADKIVSTPPPATPGGSSGPTTPPATDAIAKDQCALLGRTSKDASACNRVCVTNGGTLLQDTVSKVMYCQNAVASNIGEARCKTLNRVWVKAGCARRIDQKDTLNAPQCLAGFPYYNANFTAGPNATATDVCEKDKATATANEQSGTLGGVQVPVKGDVIPPGPTDVCPSGTVKNAAGRCQVPPAPTTPGTSPVPADPSEESPDGFKITVYKDKDFKGKFKEYTSAQALLKDGMNDSVTSYKIQKGRWQLCEDKDFTKNCVKVWASDADLSKGGKTSRDNKVSSIRPVTTTELEDAAADVLATCTNAANEAVAANADNTCPADTVLQCPDTFTLDGSECKEEVTKGDIVVPVDKNFKGKDGQAKCELLGREWIAEVKGKTINGGEYGCSTVTCNLEKDGAPRQFERGPVCISYKYDKAYAQDLGENKCKSLHRVWIDQVKRCAQMPNRKDKDQTKVKAEQCMEGYSTYYIYKAKDREDECFKPKFFQKVQGVANSTGGALGAGLQQGPKVFCNTVKGGNYHWTGKACKIDRKKCWNGASIPVTSKCPAKPVPSRGDGGVSSQEPASGGSQAPNGASWASFCASLGRSAAGNGCSSGCNDGGNARNPRNTSYGYDRCQAKSQVCEEDGTGGTKDCVSSSNGCREGGCGSNGNNTPSCPYGTYDPIYGCPGHGGAVPSRSPSDACRSVGGTVGPHDDGSGDDYCHVRSGEQCESAGLFWYNAIAMCYLEFDN